MKKIIFLTIIPVFAFVLSGCGTPKNTEPEAGFNSPNPALQNPTSSPTQASKDDAAAAAEKQKAGLSALPADDKTAIDTELSNIDKELKTTDSTLSQDDLSDTQLGL
jgi:hypothetical protein